VADDDVEMRQLRVDLMKADISNKQADTEYKRGLLRFEPWKLAFTAFGAGAAAVIALIALLTFGSHH
jgi:hypothetical protein